jgi:hypothetical protein
MLCVLLLPVRITSRAGTGHASIRCLMLALSATLRTAVTIAIANVSIYCLSIDEARIHARVCDSTSELCFCLVAVKYSL